MGQVTTVELDIAKSVFQVHGLLCSDCPRSASKRPLDPTTVDSGSPVASPRALGRPRSSGREVFAGTGKESTARCNAIRPRSNFVLAR